LIIFGVQQAAHLLLVQQINILYLLLCHLNRYNWIEIPGIGVFNGTKSSAHLNHIEKKIYPGRLLIEFDSANTFRTETMIQNIVAETGYDQDLLEEHLAALCQSISESLKKNNSYEFIPFGSISDYGGKILFQQSEKNIHQEFYWMEALDITPVEQTSFKSVVPIEPVPIRKTKSQREFYFLLIALGILWSVFLGLLLCPPNSRIQHAKNEDTSNDSIPLIPATNSSGNSMDSLLTADSLHNQINDTVITDKDSTDQFENVALIDSGNVKALDKEIKYKACVIIVGSFKKLSNAERLSREVKKSGFELFRGEYGSFHRVGIKFNCFEHDLQEMLLKLKEKFHPDAWVLMY
jgi:hypothetical protein